MDSLIFIALACTAYLASLIAGILTSVLLVRMFVPPGHGRVLVLAELFRITWSWGFDRHGLGAVRIILALVTAGMCLGNFGAGASAFMAAYAIASIPSAGVQYLMFSTL